MRAGIVFQQMAMIFLLILSGYILEKKGMFPDGTSKGMSALVVNVCNPAILLVSAVNRDPSVTNEKVLLAIGAGAVMYVVLIIAGIVLPRVMHIRKMDRSHYNMMCIFGNTGFIGIPMVLAVVGSGALIYVAIINTYYNLLIYTYGYTLVDHNGEKKKIQWKKILNTGSLSCILTLIIFFAKPPVPEILKETLTYMGNATTMLAMAVIGISLSRMPLKEIVSDGKLYLFIALRFVGVPVFLGFLFRLFIHDSDIYNSMVLLSAVPVGNLPLMMAEEQGVDGRLLSKGIILSTLLSIITIPIVVSFV